ncbi:MAG: CarD family transcriptional regulator [Evtepia sp.]
MAEEYRKGDYVSYSCNGVCLVEDIRVDAPTGKGEPKTFYILKPVADQGSTIFVPTSSPTLLAKMQRLPSRGEVDALILSTKESDLPWIEDRKVRAASFQTIIKTCNLRELLALVSCIYQHRQTLSAKGKKLTAADEAAMRRAEGLIENELSFVLQLSGDQVGAYIREKLEL